MSPATATSTATVTATATATATSADRIRSNYLHNTSIEARSCPTEALKSQESNPGAMTTPMSPQSPKEAIFEPLKICLDSGDDSSTGSSSCDDDSDYFFGFTPEQEQDQDESSLHSPSCAMEYFHKQPHKAENDTVCTNASTSGCEITSATTSVNSLPSLLGSSTDSSPQLATSYSNSITSNKKIKFNHKNKRKGRVSLHKSVSVIPIPSRCEYSLPVRKRIWSSSAEIYANAARNSVEFASEGWNWRNVIEDEEMLLHQASGELIHPIHVHNACTSQPGDIDDEVTLSVISGLVPNHSHSPITTKIANAPESSSNQMTACSDLVVVGDNKI